MIAKLYKNLFYSLWCLLFFVSAAFSATTNFPYGVTNVEKNTPFGKAPVLNPVLVHQQVIEFDQYVAGDWTVTETSSNSTQALASADMGVIELTNEASATNDVTVIQKVGQNFKFESGKELWMEARFKTSSTTTADVIAGLAITDTSPYDVADGVFFQSSGTTLSLITRKASTATTTNVGTALAADTYIRVAIHYDGVSTIELFCNGVKVADTVTTNLYTAGALRPTFAIRSLATGFQSIFTIDYMAIIKER